MSQLFSNDNIGWYEYCLKAGLHFSTCSVNLSQFDSSCFPNSSLLFLLLLLTIIASLHVPFKQSFSIIPCLGFHAHLLQFSSGVLEGKRFGLGKYRGWGQSLVWGSKEAGWWGGRGWFGEV